MRVGAERRVHCDDRTGTGRCEIGLWEHTNMTIVRNTNHVSRRTSRR